MQQQQQQQQQQGGDDTAQQQQHWRQFQGTELGGLLASIYGGQKRQISYPTPKKKAFDPTALKFRPVNSTLTSTDPTKATRKAVQVAVPKNFGVSGGGESKENLGPFIPQRKNGETIRAEIDDLYMKQRSYRPAHVRPQGDAEKDRYSQICAYHGGKALPKGLVMPSGEAPFEIQARIQQQRKNDEYNIKRRHARGDYTTRDASNKPPPSPRMTVDERMAQDIANEIDERVSHLEDLRAIGNVPRQKEAQILSEINARVAELERLKV